MVTWSALLVTLMVGFAGGGMSGAAEADGAVAKVNVIATAAAVAPAKVMTRRRRAAVFSMSAHVFSVDSDCSPEKKCEQRLTKLTPQFGRVPDRRGNANNVLRPGKA
jgi:hypothetical protein